MDSESIQSSSSYHPSIEDAEQSLLRGFHREALHVANELLKAEEEQVEVSEEASDGPVSRMSFPFRGQIIQLSVVQTNTTANRDRLIAVAIQGWYSLFQRAKSEAERDRGYPHLRAAFQSLELGVSLEIAILLVQFLSNLQQKESCLTLAVDVLGRFDGLEKEHGISVAPVWYILLCKLLPYSKEDTNVTCLLNEIEKVLPGDDSASTDQDSSVFTTSVDESVAPDSPRNKIQAHDKGSSTEDLSESGALATCVAAWKSSDEVKVTVVTTLVRFASDCQSDTSLCLPELKKLLEKLKKDGEVSSTRLQDDSVIRSPGPQVRMDSGVGVLLKDLASRAITLLRASTIDPWLSSSAMCPDRHQKRLQVVFTVFSLLIAVKQRRRLASAGKAVLGSATQPLLEIVRALLPST